MPDDSANPKRPAPFTPADCDLTDFEFMPVMVRRLLKSDTWSLGSGEERAAAVALWFESWHQVPAASLPSDDRLLKRLADSDRWPRVKTQALRGWVHCNDDRLYHPVVAQKALEAWIEKLVNSISGAAGNAKRWQLSINTSADVQRLRAAVDLLVHLDPQTKVLRKKAVLNILGGSPPDYPPESPPDEQFRSPPESPPDRPSASPPDSPGDRKGQGEGQGLEIQEPYGSVGRTDPPCPVEQIVAVYHDVLPELPRVKLMPLKRRRALQSLWRFVLTTPRSDGTPRASSGDEALGWIRDFFERARANDWLMGRTPRVNGHENWQCDLDFLLSERGLKHVIEKTREQQH